MPTTVSLGYDPPDVSVQEAAIRAIDTTLGQANPFGENIAESMTLVCLNVIAGVD
jgi:hypothetical protein